jgi:tetraacyldisaccharide 4'-kinase
MQTSNKIILTTEKDAVRLTKFGDQMEGLPFYVLPVKHHFLFDEGPVFDTIITKFIKEFKK